MSIVDKDIDTFNEDVSYDYKKYTEVFPSSSMFVNIKGNKLYRGHTGTLTHKTGVPQWFSTYKYHDYVEDYLKTGKQASEFIVNEEILLINLKNEHVRNILNLAIDRLTYNEITQFKTLLPKNVQNIKDISIIKSHLKSVYGGISFIEQAKLMTNQTFSERAQRNHNIIAGFSALAEGARYSIYECDKALCAVIVKIFAKKHKFFEGVKGWYHSVWRTPWHDKLRNGSQWFLPEVAVFLEKKQGQGQEQGQGQGQDITKIATLVIDNGVITTDIPMETRGGRRKTSMNKHSTVGKLNTSHSKSKHTASTNKNSTRQECASSSRQTSTSKRTQASRLRT